MFIIIGLGNPGKEYQKTPHNLGFMAIDVIAEENDFPAFRLSKKYKAEISEGEISGQKTILAKPQTFMNESGKAVNKIISNFPSTSLRASKFSNNLIIIHDDIDLPLGEIKICKNRGSAGHKGVESIIKALKTKNFARFRIGARPAVMSENAKDFVLKNFTKTEEKITKKALADVAQAVKLAITESIEKAMNKYN